MCDPRTATCAVKGTLNAPATLLFRSPGVNCVWLTVPDVRTRTFSHSGQPQSGASAAAIAVAWLNPLSRMRAADKGAGTMPLLSSTTSVGHDTRAIR